METHEQLCEILESMISLTKEKKEHDVSEKSCEFESIVPKGEEEIEEDYRKYDLCRQDCIAALAFPGAYDENIRQAEERLKELRESQ